MLRYLAISQARTGRRDAAEATFRELAEIEGEISSRDLQPEQYPMPSARAFELLVDSLRQVGR